MVRLTAAPRAVPFSARVHTAFGGTLATMGWLVLVGSSPFVWMYPLHSEVLTPVLFAGKVGTTSGRVIGMRRSGRRLAPTHAGHVSQGVPNFSTRHARSIFYYGVVKPSNIYPLWARHPCQPSVGSKRAAQGRSVRAALIARFII